jgi:hypothetical protein
LNERFVGGFRRIALAVGFVTALVEIANAASPVPSSAVAATPPPQPAQIDRNTALILIRTTLVAVQQANQSGNYGVLREISAPGFQSVNSAERLSQIFANLRGKNFDLSGVVVLEPQLTVLPEIYSNGVMRMAGFFPSVPMQVYFDLQFIPVQGQWRLIAIGVNVGSPISAPPKTEAPQVSPAQSAASKAAPSIEIGNPKQTPTASPRN